MVTQRKAVRQSSASRTRTSQCPDLPGQVVLVMQGGGALGAFQAGVYEAMHDAGIEPDWVVGTSIGAINGAIIAGNAPQDRLPRLREFWTRAAAGAAPYSHLKAFAMGNLFADLGTVSFGVPGFFAPNPGSWFGNHTPLGVTGASFYTTAPLRSTLLELVDTDRIGAGDVRLTVGAVSVRSGRMRYFDSRDERVSVEHVMASGALPPAFPAIVIDGEPYWDGGIHSNTPIEIVMDDSERRDSLVFAAQLWQLHGDDPQTIEEVMSRRKDIQFSSRADSQIARQQQIHRLRHVVRELGRLLPDKLKADAAIRKLVAHGCGTVIHLLPLRAPPLDGEDHRKDIDFTPEGIHARWEAGRAFARDRIEAAPWQKDCDPAMGVIVHQ
ncbi:MAG TPA: patatin [Rhodocyclaceae bacterium]|nr:MAG: patatin [Betaproteobacteria bacterium CG2_30_68_42]PIX73836.1 MAG: patatin [Rhodocyclales bacterium CG_4_10_14_3_um_filter_68_10]PJA57147.1 MAG: patatin [Rhodocyclales bacterium CG_4_9_14_3_um_filter_68_10]HCX34414.1 patatin [Rhodocyclaceae bacterium]